MSVVCMQLVLQKNSTFLPFCILAALGIYTELQELALVWKTVKKLILYVSMHPDEVVVICYFQETNNKIPICFDRINFTFLLKARDSWI